MENVIFVPLAYLPGAHCGSNVKKIRKAKEIYIENAFVALASIKFKTKNADVALVTNYDIEKKYKDLFDKCGIKIFRYSFDYYKFPNDYKYCLAFYKICALKHVLDLEFENFLMLDADIFCQKDLCDVFTKLGSKIMIYRRANSTLPILESFKTEYVVPFPKENRIPRAAGGFFACNKNNGKLFIQKCDLVYNEMIENTIIVPYGDEFITTNAVGMMRNVNYLGNSYLCICETGVYRDIPPKEILNAICLIHLPGEKNHGMRKLFRYYVNNNSIPDISKVYKIVHIYHPSLLTKIKKILKIILRREKMNK